MYVEQMYTNCLSEAAYYIESNGEAAIIDPLRDCDQYIAKAKERNATIKYVFETHFHADFVSGHIDLSNKTKAPIVYGPNANTNYDVIHAADGDTFTIGDVSIKVLHTPGHTMESSCYLLHDANKEPYCIFTGDTLFVGDVGRPDLFGGTFTKEHLAQTLYTSLRDKILPLPDAVIVYPAHGPGSACGKNMGPETFSTIGQQKLTNYALQDIPIEEFVKTLTTGLSTPPAYFPLNAKINKEGYESLDTILKQSLLPLSVAEFADAMADENVIVLDTRAAVEFTTGFVPGAISIGLENRFAEWVGTLIPMHKQLLLVTEIGKELESITRLSRVGFDNVIGYLDGGFAAWSASNQKIDMIIDVDADELAMDINYDDNLVVMDVRKLSEFDNGHIEGARLQPLQEFGNLMAVATSEEQENIYVHCAGGYRSVIACSLLKKEGVHNIRNVLGGWNALQKIDKLPIVQKAKEAK